MAVGVPESFDQLSVPPDFSAFQCSVVTPQSEKMCFTKNGREQFHGGGIIQ